MSGKMKPEEAVRATLSSLPDEVVDTVGVTALPSEDPVSERRRKLEYLEMQEELIKVDTCSCLISQSLRVCLVHIKLKSQGITYGTYSLSLKHYSKIILMVMIH